MLSLKSSVEEKGEIVDQILHFSRGRKATFRGVLTDTIQQQQFTHFDLIDGRRIYVNDDNVNWFEVLNKRNK